ncbi:hypothetical protein OKW40_003385 [Paraburkholderia sp. RAU6.4a]|nr:hypothetical protein [Paraburkholderia sp. WSM4177]MBB5483256.1 hypothetical protein [Paraburkholderia sp. WSM4180]
MSFGSLMQVKVHGPCIDAAYAQGAGTGGGGGAGAGQGGTGMGTPKASGATKSPSGASGANTMGKSGDMSQKQTKPKMQKKRE